MDGPGKTDVIVKVSELTKKYRDFAAVNHLSLDIYLGEIFGILGPNGAGKTTTINMICGLLKPDSGRIEIAGQPLDGKVTTAQRFIGICPQNIVIWGGLTCIEQLEFMGEMYRIPKRTARHRGLQLLSELGLEEKRDCLAKTLSGGMQRRLNIALALIHDPEILILDEPQAGLDPQSRVLVRDYIKKLTPRKTVILTTHDMDEAQKLAARVAIIDRGKILVLDTPDHLTRQNGAAEILQIQLAGDVEDQVSRAMAQLPEATKYNFKDNVLSIISSRAMNLLAPLLANFKANHIRVDDIKLRQKTLEDVFISLTGRGLRE